MECEHLNWAETANGRYRFCADCGRDLGAVGDEDPSMLSAGGVSPTAPDEADLAQALFRTLYDAGVSFNSGDLIPRLTATVRAAGYRHMPEVTAPDEREALRKEASDYIHKKRPEWHDNGVGIVQGSHYRSGFVDGAEWAGFRRSREATTEPQPITDADVEVAARALFEEPGAVDPNSADYMTWAEFAATDRTRADIWRDDARRVLEAVEASRSPKPTEVER